MAATLWCAGARAARVRQQHRVPAPRPAGTPLATIAGAPADREERRRSRRTCRAAASASRTRTGCSSWNSATRKKKPQSPAKTAEKTFLGVLGGFSSPSLRRRNRLAVGIEERDVLVARELVLHLRVVADDGDH